MSLATFTPLNRSTAAGTATLIAALEERIATLEAAPTAPPFPYAPEPVLSREQLTFVTDLNDYSGDTTPTLDAWKRRVTTEVGAFDFSTTIHDNEIYEGQNCPTDANKPAGASTVAYVDDFNYVVWDDYTNLTNRVTQVIPPGKYFYHISPQLTGWFKIRQVCITISCRRVSDDGITFESGCIKYDPSPNATEKMLEVSGFGFPITFYHEVLENEYLNLHIKSNLSPLQNWPSSLDTYIRVTRMCPL